jgi:hypothetical protein
LEKESDEASLLESELELIINAIDAPNRPFVKNYAEVPKAEKTKQTLM